MTVVALLTGAIALLVLCAALVAVRRRVGAASSDTTFVCKVRVRYPPKRTWRGRERFGWPRRRTRATWVHDVLLLRRDRPGARTDALPVRLPDDVIQDAESGAVRGLGGSPVVISLRLDDGTVVDVAAAARDRTLLAGPFLAAAIPGLRGGRRERPNLGR